MDEVFHAGEVQVPNPLHYIGKQRIQAGKTLMALSGLGVATAGLTLALASPKGAPSYVSSAVLAMLSAVVAFAWGVSSFLRGRRETRSVVLAPTLPANFVDGSEPFYALHDRTLRAYSIPAGLLRRLQRMWGTSSLFASAESQAVAERSLQAVLYCSMGAVLLPLLGLGLAAAGTTFAVGLVAMAGLATGAVLAWMAVYRWRLVKSLISEQSPRCEPEERIDTVDGGGDPFVLAADVEQRLMEIRNNRVPNRVHVRAGWDGAAAHVTETGRFQATFLLENQPVSTPRPPPGVTAELSAKAVPFWLGGATLACLSIPGIGPGGTIALAAFGWSVALLGHALLQDAARLSEKFRWESTAILLMAEGSTGRAEILAGRGRDDSFESKNTVIRSDCKFRWYAGKLVTESAAVNKPRSIMAVLHDADSHRVLEITAAALETFRTKGVRIREINFGDQSVENVLRANIVASQAKAAAPGMERLKGSERKELAGPKRDNAVLLTEKPKSFCTNCGTARERPEAKFCADCGTAF